jgi:hypothetical protein
VKSIPVKPATAMETSAPAMRRSVGEIWLAERGNAQQSGSQSPSYPGAGFMFAQPLNRRVAQCALAALGCIAQDDEPPATRPPLLDQLGMQEVRFVEEFIPLCPGWTTDPLTSRIGRSVP